MCSYKQSLLSRTPQPKSIGLLEIINSQKCHTKHTNFAYHTLQNSYRNGHVQYVEKFISHSK